MSEPEVQRCGWRERGWPWSAEWRDGQVSRLVWTPGGRRCQSAATAQGFCEPHRIELIQVAQAERLRRAKDIERELRALAKAGVPKGEDPNILVRDPKVGRAVRRLAREWRDLYVEFWAA